MAEEIRIYRSDSVVLSFSAIDADSGDYLDLSEYEVLFSTENYDKTSVSHPLEVRKDVDSNGKPVILVYLTAANNNPARQILHYELKIYKRANPIISITGSFGDLKFITENKGM